MKLLFCKKCNDVVKLRRDPITCECGASWGRYREDGLHAEYGGEPAVLLGIANSSLFRALVLQNSLGDNPHGLGRTFEAFIIPENAPTIHRRGEPTITKQANEQTFKILRELQDIKKRFGDDMI